MTEVGGEGVGLGSEVGTNRKWQKVTPRLAPEEDQCGTVNDHGRACGNFFEPRV